MDIKPYAVQLGERTIQTFPHDEDREEYLIEHPEIDPRDVGVIMLNIFQRQGWLDYVAVTEINDAEDEYYTHNSFEKTDWVDWLAGFALEKDRRERLKEVEKILGVFAVKYGWNATITVEDEPTEWDLELYEAYFKKQLNKATAEDFKDD